MPFNHFTRCGISKYDVVYFVGDNQANNRVQVSSFKTSNRGAFSDSLAALVYTAHAQNKKDAMTSHSLARKEGSTAQHLANGGKLTGLAGRRYRTSIDDDW